MTARPRPADGDRKPAQPRGTVSIRLQGHPDDVAKAAARLVAEWDCQHSPMFAYRDRNGITIRRYLTARIDRGN